VFAHRLHRVVVGVFFLAVLYALCFLGVAEWFFWNEFETRFNFIAVDYLLYTREVLGNIWESYPIPFLLAAIGVVSAGLLLVFWRHADVEAFLRSRTPARERLVDELSSQIDLAPTLLSLLHWNYESRFFGKDVLAMQTADERAFVSTYEAIAYYQSADALYGLHRDEAAAR
jgi:phosphoglycerol transferase MdoB-like AlkP superfamily enzyme